MSWYIKAKEKLTKEFSGKFDKYGEAMKTAVRDALLNFAEQNEEFAQAIVQGGGFGDCLKAVSKGIGSSISDLEAYKKAVSFYFPGADIEMSMKIRLEPESGEEKDGLILDLSAFL